MKNLDFSRFVIRLKYGSTLKPQRDWFLLLGAAALLLAISAVIHASIFVAVERGQTLSNEVIDMSSSTVDVSSINAALKLFDARAKAAARFAADPHYSDPSK